MENDNLNNKIGTPEDDDVMLPEGYNDENIFAEPEGDDENIFGKEDTLEGFGDEGTGDEDHEPEEEPEKPEPEKEDGVGAGSEEGGAPAAEQERQAGGLFKFKDGDQDVELKKDEISELYRFKKEHANDGVRLQELQSNMDEAAAMAKRLGFADFKEMLEKAADNYRDAEIKRLTEDPEHPVHPEVAKAIVASRMRDNAPKAASAPTQQAQKTDAPTAPVQRDYRREMSELLTDRPQLRDELKNGGTLPREVIANAIKRDISLRAAYAEHELKEVRAEAERVKQENQILRQNAAAKKKAPVKGTASGGHIETKGKDPFLQGFESDN